ncbi:MAG: fused MFS/spermidine synthase, partial [Micromonosporaceae bacterium]|nr:fused MFS/spermidine synthase [Micromonosporaceae bacterium]
MGFGTAELVPDPSRSSGWVLLIDGVAQSYVDLDDPSHLEFPYVRQIALAVEAFFGATGGAPVTDRPGACGATAEHGAPLRVLHLGGGGLTLPRYLAAARPGVRQVVVEHDELLLDLVLELLPLPDGHEVRIELGNAAQAVLAAPDATFDLVISDAYEGVQMSLDVATAQFAAELARILRPHGLCVVNVADDPPLAFSRVQAATLR